MPNLKQSALIAAIGLALGGTCTYLGYNLGYNQGYKKSLAENQPSACSLESPVHIDDFNKDGILDLYMKFSNGDSLMSVDLDENCLQDLAISHPDGSIDTYKVTSCNPLPLEDFFKE